MAKKEVKKEVKQITEKSTQMIGGGRWLVQEDGSRVQVQAPTKIKNTGE